MANNIIQWLMLQLACEEKHIWNVAIDPSPSPCPFPSPSLSLPEGRWPNMAYSGSSRNQPSCLIQGHSWLTIPRLSDSQLYSRHTVWQDQSN